jgi:hypothetical protein
MNASLSELSFERASETDPAPVRGNEGGEPLSIRAASRFVIGAAIIRDLAQHHSADTKVTLDNVAVAALRDGLDGGRLRASIEMLADQEAGWFRSTPSHALTTHKVLNSRVQEMRGLNAANLAVLATMQIGVATAEAHSELQMSYQAAIRAIDEMPGTTAERRTVLHDFEAQVISVGSDAAQIQSEMTAAQRTYLKQLMSERLADYQIPSLAEGGEPEFHM